MEADYKLLFPWWFLYKFWNPAFDDVSANLSSTFKVGTVLFMHLQAYVNDRTELDMEFSLRRDHLTGGQQISCG